VARYRGLLLLAEMEMHLRFDEVDSRGPEMRARCVRRFYLGVGSDVHERVLVFLGLRDVRRALLLRAAISGPMASFATLLAWVTRRWSAASRVLARCILALATTVTRGTMLTVLNAHI
jgi:hypothetical protein